MATVTPLLTGPGDTPDSSLIWTNWAIEALAESLADYERFEDYYDGNHELEFATDKWVQTFGTEFEEFSDNWCQVVVDSMAQRMQIIGWKSEDDDAAAAQAEDIWDRQNLGVEMEDLTVQTLVKGDAFMFVWEDPDHPGQAEMYYNDPTEVAVFYDPANMRRISRATKRYVDEWGNSHLWLYTPRECIHYVVPASITPQQIALLGLRGEDLNDLAIAGGWIESERIPNKFGTVPLHHFKNRARGSTHGLSELKSVIPVQNYVNKLLMDMGVGSEFGSFRQKWIAGGTAPKQTDGTTGWRAGEDRVWHTTDPMTKFGEFGQIDLEPIFKAVEVMVGHIAKITQTPVFYLRSTGDMPSGEALKTAESGLVKKCVALQRRMGVAWSSAMGMALTIEGHEPKSPVFPIWKSPETRHDLEQAQTAQLKSILGIPLEQLWSEHFGYTEEEIATFKEQNHAIAASALADVIAQVGQLPPGTGQFGANPQQLIQILQNARPTDGTPDGQPNDDGSGGGLDMSQILALLPKSVTAATTAGEATAKPQPHSRPPGSPTRKNRGFDTGPGKSMMD